MTLSGGKTPVFRCDIQPLSQHIHVLPSLHGPIRVVIGSPAVDAAAMTFPSNNLLQNGADAVALYRTATAVANRSPIVTDNLLDAVVYDTNDLDNAALLELLTLGGSQINENGNNNNKDFESIARLPDGDGGIGELLEISSPTPGKLNSAPDTGISFLQSLGGLSLSESRANENTGDSYLISLKTFPSSDVVIMVSPNDQLDIGNGPGESIEFRFTADNAIIPQTIRVVAVDDRLIEGDHRGLIHHTTISDDPTYADIDKTLQASIVDNESDPLPSVVISEIMYNPASEESSPGVGEWIEVVNIGTNVVDLGGWLLDDEDNTAWSPLPLGTTLAATQAAVLFDESFTTASEFRASWNVPDSALLIGIDWANLANSPTDTNEVLLLLDSTGRVIDEVNFQDTTPWPRDNNASSIYLENLELDNSLGENWRRSAGNGPDLESGTFSTDDVGSPGSFERWPGDANSDGAVSLADFAILRSNYGRVDAVFAEGDFDEDGQITLADFLILSKNFGRVG